MKKTKYHPSWQDSRIKFMLSQYPREFFKGKRILELAPFNGYIGAYFQELGAEVHCIEGRQTNVDNILRDYPNVTAEVGDLDTESWNYGKWDIIINFGLCYHLQFHHKDHLINCIDNCDLMFFESVIHDSYDDTIYFREEGAGIEGDQSLSILGGAPTTFFVENIFRYKDVEFSKHTNSSLNGDGHHYNWQDTGRNIPDGHARRMWVVKPNTNE